MTPLDISDLILAARAGGDDAKDKLLVHFRHYLRLLANLHVRPMLKAKFDESDIVQETCMHAIRSFEQFRGETEKQLAAWLRQIMANAGAEMARKQLADKRDAKLEVRLQNNFDKSSMDFANMLPDNNSSPSRVAIRRERSVKLADAIAKVGGEKREVLIRHGLQGLPIRDVAESMGRTEASTWKLWARGLQELRKFSREIEG